MDGEAFREGDFPSCSHCCKDGTLYVAIPIEERMDAAEEAESLCKAAKLLSGIVRRVRDGPGDIVYKFSHFVGDEP